jgi:translation initiation factor eIF-2B subunit beta
MAAAAKHHHVPVVVCTGLYKLSALQPSDEDLFNLLVGPDPVLRYDDENMESADVINPYFDYVAPEFISLYLTNA